MQSTKAWVFASFFVVALITTVLLLGTSSSSKAELAPEVKDHWQHHDGHWSFWHEADHRWYYTDGQHWFWNDGKEGDEWKVYRFDKDHKFGVEFERGEYKIPGVDVKIEVPRHGVFHKK